MLAKEKSCRLNLVNKIIFFLKTFIIYLFFINISSANLQEKLINKITTTETLSFNFNQKIAENEEIGNCVIKYPLLMKCNYQNLKQKSIISNGKTVAVIKKKYKKIYYYPIKATPLFFILDKEKILNLIKNNKPTKINARTIEFEIVDKKSNIIKIFFEKSSLEFKGWEMKDVYSNNVKFTITDLKTNETIPEKIFKIPREEDL